MSRMRNWGLCITVAVAANWLTVGEARADRFLLASGGEVQGEWINAEESSPSAYQVRTAVGVVSLAAEQVRQVVEEEAARQQYDRQAPTLADTVENHWRLAQWCRKEGLQDACDDHLRRVIQLEPDHAQARAWLGYYQFKGQWITRDEYRREEGLLKYRGKWRTAQEIELLERKDKRQRSRKEWLAQLTRWRKQIASNDSREAAARIAGVRDTRAVPALTTLLRREQLRSVKELYIDTLAQIGGSDAVKSLIFTSLHDPDEEIFHACLEELVRLEASQAVAAYVKALKDENNVRVNRAGRALGQLGDDSAIPPLIDALATTHTVVPAGGSSEQVTTTFSDSGVGFTRGGGSQAFPVRAQNAGVLEGLVRLTGASFSYNQHAWRHWYESHQRSQPTPALNARRQ